MPYGMYLSTSEEVKRWEAESSNSSARLELARTKKACELLLSQHDPVASLNIDRDALRILLDFVRHHDPERLYRQCEIHLAVKGANGND